MASAFLTGATATPEDRAEALIASPTDPLLARQFVSSLKDEMGIFRAQEDTLFDYKREYPHSQTDAYFAAICRLIFAFYNSFGGVVVLGVDDTSRTCGHNKKIVNIEKLNTRLRELCGQSLNVRHFNVQDGKSEEDVETSVDLLIVPKRSPNIPPAILKVKLEKYSPGVVWLRRGHEVLEATSQDTGFLFSPRENINSLSPSRIASFLPSRPSRINRFVGRIDILSNLFSWVAEEDEPRKFLWGRGGSGKSTVAYEFATIVRDYGKALATSEGDNFDRVVFLTAKEFELNTSKGRIQETGSRDFSDYDSLLSSILIACDYSSEEDFTRLSRREKTERLKDLFQHESILIVIDDIDTLTTKGEEFGFDELYKLALRAQRTVRILYTQRNQPVSSENAIEVPGFKKFENYSEFVEGCCEQFNVPMPNDSYLRGALRSASESIPLIIETIIGLRKSCGTYERAHSIFLERRGEEARRYLFEREYEALSRDNNARHVLATIAEFGKPVGNDEVGAVVRIGDDLVSESIGEVLGFFLSTSISNEGETKYFVNPVTRTFLKEKSTKLDFGEAISERVRSFKSSGQKKPKEVVIIEANVERYWSRNDFSAAKELVTQTYPPRVTESAAFRMLRARTLSKCEPPMAAEARDDFQYCLDQGYENADGMRDWIFLEKKCHSLKSQVDICDRVIGGKSYADVVIHEFIVRKATVTYFMARDLGVNSIDAFDLLSSALQLHTKSFVFFRSAGRDANLNYKYSRSTAFSLINNGRILGYDKQLINTFKDIHKRDGCICSPLEDPFLELLGFLLEGRNRTGDVGRRRDGLVRSLRSDIEKNKILFERQDVRQKMLSRLQEL